MTRIIIALALFVGALPVQAQNAAAQNEPQTASYAAEIQAWQEMLAHMRAARGADAAAPYDAAEAGVVAIIDSLRTATHVGNAATERSANALSAVANSIGGMRAMAGVDAGDLPARVRQRTAVAGGVILLAVLGFGMMLNGLLQKRRERRGTRMVITPGAERHARLWTARTLAQTGHEASEISRTVGMPRDAVNLLRHRKMTTV